MHNEFLSKISQEKSTETDNEYSNNICELISSSSDLFDKYEKLDLHAPIES